MFLFDLIQHSQVVEMQDAYLSSVSRYFQPADEVTFVDFLQMNNSSHLILSWYACSNNTYAWKEHSLRKDVI